MKRKGFPAAPHHSYVRVFWSTLLLLLFVVGPMTIHLSHLAHLISGKDGEPPMSVWAAPLPAPVRVNPGCADLIQGGDFEVPNHPAWLLQGTGRFPEYRSEETFNDSTYALRLGNGLELPNIESVSEARHIPITLPYGATSIILRFRYWPLIDGTPDAYDMQQVDIFDATTEQLLDQPLLVQDDARTWKLVNRDLTALAGRQISIRFRVRNDGLGPRTLMYIDNVELEYCPASEILTTTPTATATYVSVTTTPTAATATVTPIVYPTVTSTGLPSATATPIYVPTVVPTADPSCTNILADPSFEGWDGWLFGDDPVPPVYVAVPAHSGTRAVQLGNPPDQPTNVQTFSSARQLVTVPYDITRAELRWWKQLRTEQGGNPNSWSDRQDVILLSPTLQPITILRREWRNDGASGYWQEDVADLTAYRGQSFYVYFNAFNDGSGGRTWMYLDDVQLNLCGGGWAAPYDDGKAYVAPYDSKGYAVNTPVAIPLTSAPTFTAAPLPTPSPLPTQLLPPTELIVPPPTITPFPTATEFVLPTITETPLPPAAVSIPSPVSETLASPTSNVYAVPTLPPAVVVSTETPGQPNAASSIVTVAPPASTSMPAVSNERPLWLDRLGPISVLLGILILIGFIIGAIVRTFRRS